MKFCPNYVIKCEKFPECPWALVWVGSWPCINTLVTSVLTGDYSVLVSVNKSFMQETVIADFKHKTKTMLLWQFWERQRKGSRLCDEVFFSSFSLLAHSLDFCSERGIRGRRRCQRRSRWSRRRRSSFHCWKIPEDLSPFLCWRWWLFFSSLRCIRSLVPTSSLFITHSVIHAFNSLYRQN